MRYWGMSLIMAGVFLVVAHVVYSEDGIPIDIGYATRTYLLHVPENLPAEPVPLVLALHPLIFDAGLMRGMTGFDEIADREGFIVAYPNGRWRLWDVLWNWEHELEFLTVLIDTLIDEQNVDPERVFAAGASNGAMMCHLLAWRAPERIAAIAAVMGTPPRIMMQEHGGDVSMPVLIIHGTNDPVVPYGNNPVWYSAPATAAFWAQQNGCFGDPVTTRLPVTNPQDGTSVDFIQYACGEGPPVVLYCVHGAGHTWPGGFTGLPDWMLGRTSHQINASELAWEFFSAQTAGN